MNRVLSNVLKQVRFFVTRRGYDIHPIDPTCWNDQQSLLSSAEVNTIFDVGANRGDVSAEYRALFPLSRVHCFEPMTEFAEALVERFKADSNIEVHQMCLGAS